MAIQITPLTGSVGAQVQGVNLNEPVDVTTFEVLHRAFLDAGVLVFRGQRLQPAAHVQFAKLWGNPAQNNPLDPSVPGFPGLIQVTKIPKETASTEAWHSDSIYTAVPPKISILSAVVVPHGGDTMWCNQYVSYDRLSPTMQRMLEGLRVRFAGLRLAQDEGNRQDSRGGAPDGPYPSGDPSQGTLRGSPRDGQADRRDDGRREPPAS